MLARIDLVRVNDRTLNLAGTLEPVGLRSLNAIHLATAGGLGLDLGELVSYDERMAVAARALGFRVNGPARANRRAGSHQWKPAGQRP